MADFILVHGAWHGGWCWSRVLPLLQQAGHRAHAPTLTGVGDRRHLLSPAVDLHTHVTDTVEAIANEEFDRVILVGHSYAGMVITGVADRMPTRVARLVYLDAIVPLPGESWSSGHPPDVVAGRVAAAAPSQGLSLPPPDPIVYGLSGADRDWVARRQSPHPFAPYRQPLDFDGTRWRAMPRTFIDCVEPPLATVEPSRRRVREQPGWDLRVMQVGHDPMVQAPRALADLLIAIAG